MKIGYGIDCDPAALRKHGADRVWIDTKKSNRAERAEMFLSGLRRGETLLLLSRSQLGRGREIPRLEAMLSDMGVAVEIAQVPEVPRLPPGPAPAFRPNYSQERRIRHYWHGPFKRSEALRQSADIMGKPVTAAPLNRHLGPRSKPSPWINEEPK